MENGPAPELAKVREEIFREKVSQLLKQACCIAHWRRRFPIGILDPGVKMEVGEYRKESLRRITKWVEILILYMLFRGRKYLSNLDGFRPVLIRGRPLYCQSSSPSTAFWLNCGRKYLQLLLSQCIYPNHIFACVYQEIKPKGGEPD